MKAIKGRLITLFALAVVLLTFTGMVVLTVVYANAEPETYYPTLKPEEIFIEGQYSVDGGEWHDTLDGEMLHTRFHKAVIKGKMNLPAGYRDGYLVVFAENIWYKMDVGYMRLDNRTGKTSLTPGNSIDRIQTSLFQKNAEENVVTLELEFPYTMFSNADLSDFFRLYHSGPSGVYELLISRVALSVLVCVLVCFFGLFAFPIAGSVLGGINIRYLAFSLLCFFTGVHLLLQTLCPFLPLWIDEPVLSMSLCESSTHLFGLCVLIFIKVIFKDDRHKIIGNVVLLLYSLLILVLFAMNFAGVMDLYASRTNAHMFFSVCAVVLGVCLFREIKPNPDARSAVFTLIPLVGTLVYDTANRYIGFSDQMLFELGVAIALGYQIVSLVIDLRRQYKEFIRYQQMQKELVEARVAIMVSQIQPHFLYNSLTSIAMMCSIDPETAQEATITFADYLRGNMDSLKQKTPVPFSKELEHLKKYLYIEKLRFGDDLNIAYDIQTESFVLPQLSIQPLVENAVKHGVGMKREGGTVTIATRETEDAFEVIVSDDGVGFDTEQTKNDGRSHIGMDNVRRRLKEMCGGSVTITSVVGEGTVAMVTLPKEGQNHENPVL